MAYTYEGWRFDGFQDPSGSFRFIENESRPWEWGEEPDDPQATAVISMSPDWVKPDKETDVTMFRGGRKGVMVETDPSETLGREEYRERAKMGAAFILATLDVDVEDLR